MNKAALVITLLFSPALLAEPLDTRRMGSCDFVIKVVEGTSLQDIEGGCRARWDTALAAILNDAIETGRTNYNIQIPDYQVTVDLTDLVADNPEDPPPNDPPDDLADITLSWSAPTKKTDGTDISSPISYRIYWDSGNGSDWVIRGGTTETQFVSEDHEPGTYRFVSTAIVSGVESVHSNVATKTVP